MNKARHQGRNGLSCCMWFGKLLLSSRRKKVNVVCSSLSLCAQSAGVLEKSAQRKGRGEESLWRGFEDTLFLDKFLLWTLFTRERSVTVFFSVSVCVFPLVAFRSALGAYEGIWPDTYEKIDFQYCLCTVHSLCREVT